MSTPEFRRESEMREPVLAWLRRRGYLAAVEFQLCGAYADIVAGDFGDRPSPGRVPPLRSTISIELKLHAFGDVLLQAMNNANGVTESYLAMPDCRCRLFSPASWQRIAEAGIGVLSVTRCGARVLTTPEHPTGKLYEHRERNLWRRIRSQYIKQEKGQS